jgi:transcriptional regulator with XRE-family HTH domain
MLGTIIQQLLERHLTTVKEIAEVTGRGRSTVYRWLGGESEPQFHDMRQLVRRLAKLEARQTLVGLLTSDLPVVINWVTDDEGFHGEDDRGNHLEGHEVLQRTLLALECVSDALSQQHEAIRRQELTPQGFTSLVQMLDSAIRHLTRSKNMLEAYRPEVLRHATPKAKRAVS